jgi:hypothetical protein
MAVAVLVLTQLIAAIAYAAFWIDPRPTHSDMLASLEFDSFFVAPIVWAALVVAGLWLLRQPMKRRQAVAVRAGLVLSGVCGGVAVAVAGVMVFAEVVFWLTDF